MQKKQVKGENFEPGGSYLEAEEKCSVDFEQKKWDLEKEEPTTTKTKGSYYSDSDEEVLDDKNSKKKGPPSAEEGNDEEVMQRQEEERKERQRVASTLEAETKAGRRKHLESKLKRKKEMENRLFQIKEKKERVLKEQKDEKLHQFYQEAPSNQIEEDVNQFLKSTLNEMVSN